MRGPIGGDQDGDRHCYKLETSYWQLRMVEKNLVNAQGFRTQDEKYRSARSVLVVVGGLPATGKSTIAGILARQTKTPYLRVDRIEQATVAWSSLSHPLGPVGYAVAYELAREQLQLDLDVIVECVNPITLTRDSWLRTADEAGGRDCGSGGCLL